MITVVCIVFVVYNSPSPHDTTGDGTAAQVEISGLFLAYILIPNLWFGLNKFSHEIFTFG